MYSWSSPVPFERCRMRILLLYTKNGSVPSLSLSERHCVSLVSYCPSNECCGPPCSMQRNFTVPVAVVSERCKVCILLHYQSNAVCVVHRTVRAIRGASSPIVQDKSKTAFSPRCLRDAVNTERIEKKGHQRHTRNFFCTCSH